VTRKAAPSTVASADRAVPVGDAIFWCGHAIGFRPGDSVATALMRTGIVSFGPRACGGHYSVFCGIGQCQGCLVADGDGQVLEACLRPCADGGQYRSVVPAALGDA
jgi:hypothetical protein